MNQEFQKVAIVTGGGSGLGLATSIKLVSEGIKTIIVGRNQQKLDDAKAQLGPLAETIAFDLSKLNEIPALIDEIKSRFGRIDILVNNAGINMKKEFGEVSDADFFEVINTNVLSVFSISREVSKVMMAQGSGAIVMISSMAAKYGIPKVIAYTAAKSAIEGMTKAMAVELSPKGIRVNCVAPGFIVTEMSSKALNNDPERKNKVLGRTPMGYLGETSDIAEAVYYFASDASKYVTGTSLAVDGGNSIGF
ncbi:SDR family NAD(P)-dependent oxidoreductase [Belliella kenyensis]|uniref:SDR family NAD(P)-dependent oxidoreductase n=1 Tax=Belliella kenyensis TaxID=1472724 RepID=A0ABV8ER24_9BACT|nr:SDR family oxidoreductase [Belliella kenyensis]MCH7402020.1 SDR family oxidoreductase [Belliella kenyensis]MDN3605184.1 SDR family oxidoreductase [Belliella kenyensis]